MTLEITNEAQAQERKEYLDKIEWCLNFERKQPYVGSIEENRAALAAYEQAKAVKDIVLSEDAITVLKFAVIDSNAPFEELRMHGLIWKGSTLGITDAGRAYLDAQKPREPKWEVWINIDEEKLICSCPTPQIAAYICTFYNSAQVREVQ